MCSYWCANNTYAELYYKAESIIINDCVSRQKLHTYVCMWFLCVPRHGDTTAVADVVSFGAGKCVTPPRAENVAGRVTPSTPTTPTIHH